MKREVGLKVAGLPQPRVHASGIGAMHLRKRAPDAVRVLRGQDQMHVVRHEHPCPNAHLRFRAVFAQQIEIKPVIVVAEKGLGAAIATLCDVVWQVRDYHARQTSH